ncbi:hypothetical protein E4T66_09145 [Sinimarinibacterium sp. CAU 1509]|uniref:hypothetical protein n=1 Tax=Sinimarinibacterium sp. CAU 1509 TaxID=2562283 RepID=UPI0010AD75CA|nr:hypothetical protein [Sinimarinibacterium sp. CAU 1509]TJY60819.1 hypothetical protein E4T66_09145 [Sinimarinibacterium sp. CAU 1509]
MITWLTQRQWESLFAIAELASVPSLAWMLVGAALMVARIGSGRGSRLLRLVSTLALMALTLLLMSCWLSADLTADPVLAQHLRRIAFQLGFNVLIGAGIAAGSLLLMLTAGMRLWGERPHEKTAC